LRKFHVFTVAARPFSQNLRPEVLVAHLGRNCTLPERPAPAGRRSPAARHRALAVPDTDPASGQIGTVIATVIATVIGTVIATVIGTVIAAVIGTVIGTVSRTVVRTVIGRCSPPPGFPAPRT
jgi:hypothetical protein